MLLLDTLRGPRAPGRGANPSGVFHGLCLNKIHERNYPECCTSKLNLGDRDGCCCQVSIYLYAFFAPQVILFHTEVFFQMSENRFNCRSGSAFVPYKPCLSRHPFTVQPHTARKYFPYPFFSCTVAEMCKVARIQRKLVFEKLVSAKILKVNAPNPKLGNTFIAQIAQMFQWQLANHQTDGYIWRSPL